MDASDEAYLRLEAIKIAQQILHAKTQTVSALNNWHTAAPTTDEVIAEAGKIFSFIQGE